MTSTTPAVTTVHSAAEAPSLGWVMRRAALGLAIMFAVTGLAAFLAQASIDSTADGVEGNPNAIAIGTPASKLLTP